MLSTTSRSSDEPLAMMVLVRTSLLNRNGTNELSAPAVAEGRFARFAPPTCVPRGPGSVAKQSPQSQRQLGRIAVLDREYFDQRIDVGCFVQLANQFPNQGRLPAGARTTIEFAPVSAVTVTLERIPDLTGWPPSIFRMDNVVEGKVTLSGGFSPCPVIASCKVTARSSADAFSSGKTFNCCWAGESSDVQFVDQTALPRPCHAAMR